MHLHTIFTLITAALQVGFILPSTIHANEPPPPRIVTINAHNWSEFYQELPPLDTIDINQFGTNLTDTAINQRARAHLLVFGSNNHLTSDEDVKKLVSRAESFKKAANTKRLNIIITVHSAPNQEFPRDIQFPAFNSNVAYCYLKKLPVISDIIILLDAKGHIVRIDEPGDIDASTYDWEKEITAFSKTKTRKLSELKKARKTFQKKKVSSFVGKILQKVGYESEALPNLNAKYYLFLKSRRACGPCYASMPSYVKAYDMLKQHGIEVILLSNGQIDTRWYIRKFNIPFPAVVNRSINRDEIEKMLEASREQSEKINTERRSIPYATLVNSRGDLLIEGSAKDVLEQCRNLTDSDDSSAEDPTE